MFSSPLRRARETAERIASHHQLPVQIVPEITEVDVGAWEGRSWIDIEQSETEGYRRFVENPDKYGYRDGENLGQVRDRVVPAVNRILSETSWSTHRNCGPQRRQSCLLGNERATTTGSRSRDSTE